MGLRTIHVESNSPSFTETEVETYDLEDETSYVEFWQIDFKSYESTIFRKPESASASYKWPSKEKPEGFYKFASFWIEKGQSVTNIERSTYGILDFLGDAGGLYDGLIILSRIFVSPFGVIMMQTKLYNHFSRLSASSNESLRTSNIKKSSRGSTFNRCQISHLVFKWMQKKYRIKLARA